ncbi:MAG: hypothetical protein GEU87_02425 [Alphaproteobacteria bacterium]|nr:hypothetical protein [Alphaproteobacteria bacterium]
MKDSKAIRLLTQLCTLPVELAKGVSTLEKLKSIAGPLWQVSEPRTVKRGGRERKLSRCVLIISGPQFRNLQGPEKEKAIKKERDEFARRLVAADMT